MRSERSDIQPKYSADKPRKKRNALYSCLSRCSLTLVSPIDSQMGAKVENRFDINNAGGLEKLNGERGEESVADLTKPMTTVPFECTALQRDYSQRSRGIRDRSRREQKKQTRFAKFNNTGSIGMLCISKPPNHRLCISRLLHSTRTSTHIWMEDLKSYRACIPKSRFSRSCYTPVPFECFARQMRLR